MTITVKHSKTLVVPSTGSEDKIYGTDYVSATSHTLTGSIDLSGADASGILAEGRFPELTGDVTTVAGAIATTLAAGSASNLNSGVLATARGGTGVDNSTGGTANQFWARPNGATGAVTYRAVVAADVPTLNQNTTGSAATMTTPRAIYGNNFDGSAALTQIIGSAFGGTGNGFTKFSGPTTAERTFTLPDESATIARTNDTNTFTGVQTLSSAPVFSSLTTAGILHNAGATGAITSSLIVNADITASTIDLTTKVTGALPAANGGTGVANNAAMTVTGSGDHAYTRILTAPTSVTFPTSGTLSTLAGSEAFTNKTYNKVTITAPATSATLTVIDGTTLTGPAASGTAMTLGNTETVTGVKTFGSADAVGRLKIAGTTSGAVTLDAMAAAGTGVWTLPDATDTVVGKATTDTLTNKTLTSPTLTTSLVVAAGGFTAFAALGANTLTIGGTGASAVFAIPGTLEQSATTGALTVAGGVYIAKKLNVVGTLAAGATTITGALSATGLVSNAAGADIASATAVNLTTATGNTVVITGTTPSTSLTMNTGQQMILLPSGAWPLTFHATTMNINGGVDYVCAAGDRLYCVKDLAGVIRVSVTRQVGSPMAGMMNATGGTITTSGAYTIHTFTSSGTFTPNKSGNVDYLVVAGGGGCSASGAGAGGLRSTVTATGGGGSLETVLAVTATGLTVTIGAGGAGSANGQTTDGTNGSNSVFSTITATGGAGGRTEATPKADGKSGGSGSGGFVGGGAGAVGYTGIGGAGTANQGYAGGNSAVGVGGTSSAGAGGGAGAVGGTPPVNNTNAAGGAGVAVLITGSSVIYSGGGGSGMYVNGTASAGGNGGGGNGSTGNAAGSSGTVNTGGGAGGTYSAAYNTDAYNGGSGIVIIRYLT